MDDNIFYKKLFLFTSATFFILLLSYYSFWIFGASYPAIVCHILSYFSLLGAWLFALILLIFTILLKREKNPNWKWTLFATISIIIYYLGIFIGLNNGFYITV